MEGWTALRVYGLALENSFVSEFALNKHEILRGNLETSVRVNL